MSCLALGNGQSFQLRQQSPAHHSARKRGVSIRLARVFIRQPLPIADLNFYFILFWRNCTTATLRTLSNNQRQLVMSKMSATWTKAPLALALLSVVAIVATHVVLLQNGTAKMILDNITSPRPVLPGTDLLLKTTWTRLWPLDLDFSLIVSFFSAILDMRNTSLFFQGSHFFGL